MLAHALVYPALLAVSPLSWDAAYQRAAALLDDMTFVEQQTLMRGIGWKKGELTKWWYVGNTAPIPRLNIPSLNMQDAAGGFRTYWSELVGTVTCWPSLLSMAATWDVEMMRAFAQALGAEFAAKGANVLLGPSINLHRVPRNGRNFEYLSGEDPYLGARLTEQYVEGVQSNGVLAVAKHFAFNNQETFRTTYASVVDEKTRWELYYPPFEAAVNANVSAFMCSYNRESNGSSAPQWSCENPRALSHDLKGAMGFRGFVQSDWDATHSTSVMQGLDQEMPMSVDNKATPDSSVPPYWFSSAALEVNASALAVREAAQRILAAMIRLNVSTNACTPPACETHLRRNVTSAAHVDLARDAATASIVLLKNAGGLLPLRPGGKVRTIAIVGAAADAPIFDPNGASQGGGSWNTGDYYSGGGSGHVVAPNATTVTAYAGIARRAAAAGFRVVASLSNTVSDGVRVASKADVAIVVGGTSSGEAMDRANLTLDHGADALIAAVAGATGPSRTIVLTQVCGAIVTPWRDEVAALLTLFLGGQQTGTAWGAVLFGDHSPTGKLPVTFPASEALTIAPTTAPWNASIPYREGMATGYRNTSNVPAFPFGHGLSYSSFDFGAPSVAPCAGDALCVSLPLHNNGTVKAATVAQLYLHFPPVAAHPSKLLKGFVKTRTLAPAELQTVTFRLTPRDRSYYDAEAARWVQAADADLLALIGASSADIRQQRKLHVGGDAGREVQVAAV